MCGARDRTDPLKFSYIYRGYIQRKCLTPICRIMFKSSILRNNTRFAGYEVVRKLSLHHEGEREVYLVTDDEGRTLVLTVFNLKCDMYATDRAARKRQPDFIEEVRFMRECAVAADNREIKGVPGLLKSGIDTYSHHRYAWMAQEFIEGDSLSIEINRQTSIPVKDAMRIFQTVSVIAEAAYRFTNGGGHYNISTDNIIVRYDGDELVDVRLIGFSNIGTSYNGNTPIDEKWLDSRFRAPETMKGIFSFRSDIYSLGMVLLLMLTGNPTLIETGAYTIDIGGGTVDLAELTPSDFHKAVWKLADKNVGSVTRLVLRKATETSPSSRYATFQKFRDFVGKIGSKQLEAHTVKEESGNAAQSRFPDAGPDDACHASETCTGERGRVKENDGCQKGKTESPKRKGGFAEVAGMAELKALFRRDFIRIVRNPKFAEAYGIKPSNATLLYGPQGCGKTFIAERAAQESGLRYKVVRPSDLGSIYIHGAQQKIAETFAEAEKKGPMILIFDEFDAIVPRRDSDMNENQANEVNEMLTQLNDCAERGVYCLCTTNRPDRIDPAVMRKGRVDRSIYVSLPDYEARRELFAIALRNRPVDADVDCGRLAMATENYTCSDIAFIIEEVARVCFEETLDKCLSEPLPISMSRIMEIAKATKPSVSEDQRKEYLALKEKMENRNASDGRKKVGFLH